MYQRIADFLSRPRHSPATRICRAPRCAKASGNSFANVVSGWTPSTTQNTQALFKAQDLQVAKYSSGFAMAHRMGLAGLTMGTNASAVTTITYDGNTSTELYRSTGTTSTTSLALFDNFSPLNSSSTYYYIVKHLTAYTLNSGYKVTTTSGNPVYQWSQAITNSQIDKGNYKAFSPTPAFRNFARRYSYTGTSQTFTPIIACQHKMECWGAGGGYGYWVSGGYITMNTCGAYCCGVIALTNLYNLYIYVGGQGKSAISSNATVPPASFNGGGSGVIHSANSLGKTGSERSGAGGGATDIRITPCSSVNTWDEYSSLKTRIIVAAGGGGTHLFDSDHKSSSVWNTTRDGCHGGGLAVTGDIMSWGAGLWTPVVNQTSGFEFGKGEDGKVPAGSTSNGGGGGGWYGGHLRPNISANIENSSSSGGSSFISGHEGCLALDQSNSVSTPKHKSSGTSLEKSKYNDTYYFTSTVMIDGRGYAWTTSKGSLEPMPDPTTVASNYASGVGHTGNGYARITCKPYD